MTRPDRRGENFIEAPASTAVDNGSDGIDWPTGTLAPPALDDLADVDAPSPVDGYVLTFDTTNGWQAEAPSGSGGSPNLDGGHADSNYGGVAALDAGGA